MTHRTRRAGTYFCSALVTTLLWIASLHAAPGRLPYVLVPSSGPTASVVVPVDANNDGVDDMLRITPYQVTLLSANGQYGWDRRNTDSLMRLSADAYVSGAAQGKHPLVVIPARDRWNPRADSLFFYVIRADSGDDDRTGSERSHWTVMIESIMPDPRRDQSWGINSVSFCDLNGDGEEEALAAVISGYGLQPRGVYAVGPTARTTLWRYGTGFNPGNIVVGDVDGDSLEDIIVGCIAPGNGGLENGLDDGTNYVLCLNRDGTRKWATTLRRVGSGGFVWVAVTDLTGDGRNEVVAVDNCILTDASPDRLLVLDGATGKVVDSAIAGGAAAEQRFQSLTLADLEGRGKPSMVVTRPNGRVEVRDARLRVVHEASLKGEVTMVKTARLLPDSGMQLVVVSTYQNKVSLLDGRLNLLAEYIPSQVPDGIWAVSKGSGKPATLLVRLAKPPSTADLYREFTILMAEPVPNPIPWPWVSAALAALLVGALLAGTYLELLRRRQVRHLVTSSCASVAVLRVDRRRRIVEANPATGELSPSSGEILGQDINKVLGNEDYAALRDAIRSVLAGEADDAERRIAFARKESDQDFYLARVSRLPGGGAVVVFENLSTTEQSRRTAMWTTVVQRLAHSIKTPLATIRGAAQLLAGTDNSDIGRKVRIEAERLGAMVDGMMRLASVRQTTLAVKDVGSIVRRTLEEQGVYAQSSVDVVIRMDGPFPAVRVDEELLVAALGNVVRNAVEAMPQGGKLSVSASLTDRPGFVRIAVGDTGPGVSEEHRAKLFQPFFTRKAGGTGLGLALTRKTLQDMGGDIDIAPASGSGAEFRLDVPIADSREA